ncbi:MAG: transmembrane 220 family protein [Longimicrobiales bacterium]
MGIVMRAITIVMMLAFFFGAAVQYNDPDPVAWMAIYFVAAFACLLALRSRLPRWLPWAIAGAALIWAARLAPGVIATRVGPDELVQEFEMASPVIEQGREMYGLLIILVWMIVLAITTRRARIRA